MRSCLGIILLILLVIAIAITAFYQWETNSRIEFSARDEGDPALEQNTVPIKDVAPKDKTPSAIEQDVMKMNVPEPAQPETAPTPEPQPAQS